MFKIGDIVTRKKYNNDIVFSIYKISGKTVYLKGVDVRLIADTTLDDLSLSTITKKKDDVKKIRNIKTDEFFFIPGKILHIDSDNDYLTKCKEYYLSQNLHSDCYLIKEKDVSSQIKDLMLKHKPNIIVITGHDAYYKKRKNNEEYKNSKYYITSVIESRKLESSHDKLIIIAGACQSDFVGLIKSGATYASSPKKVNIHALDPAIIASFLALSPKKEYVDTKEVVDKTHYKEDGIGGIEVKGTMDVGYPRGE